MTDPHASASDGARDADALAGTTLRLFLSSTFADFQTERDVLQRRVFPELRQHSFGEMLRRGLFVTINSDDPAYFGGYIGDNYVGTAKALGLTVDEMVRVARNSFSASFLSNSEKQHYLDAVDAYAATAGKS